MKARNLRNGLCSFVIIFVSLGVLNSPVLADTIDLTTTGSEGWLEGALFMQFNPEDSTGTGVIDPFLRLQGNNSQTTIEKGYNTSGTIEFDTKDDPHTHDLLLSDIPEVLILGVLYREFFLDLAEPGSDTELSLTLLKLHVEDSGLKTGYPGSFSAPVYNMDATTDASVVLLDAAAAAGPGNGKGDMLVFIQSSLFGDDDSKFVYLYSEFEVFNGSFEEWGVGADGPILPEPSTVILLLLGGVSIIRKRIRRKV